jgi:hypothetical protein
MKEIGKQVNFIRGRTASFLPEELYQNVLTPVKRGSIKTLWLN